MLFKRKSKKLDFAKSKEYLDSEEEYNILLSAFNKIEKSGKTITFPDNDTILRNNNLTKEEEGVLKKVFEGKMKGEKK